VSKPLPIDRAMAMPARRQPGYFFVLDRFDDVGLECALALEPG
jgi:hypothetical protein